ncbi:MAG: hypothetical protein JJT76_10335, partial [Clostridiaceae bacterium]|nr:hypothetical protein [Clostridiaceae bacterium]
FEGKEALTIKLEETVAGTAFEGKVRIAAVDVEGIQLWTNDGNGNWYDINQVGWGPVEGFEIDLETETEIYVFVAESVTEDINVTFKLVDATDVDNVIVEGTKTLIIEE